MIEFLLVEDNQDDAELTLRVFRKHHILNKIHHVHDGAEALQFLNDINSNSLKLILLDIRMPKVDGLEVLLKIKSDESKKHLPVVLMGSSKKEIEIMESHDLAVSAYIIKPLEFEQFADVISQIGLFWLLINKPSF